LTRAPASNRWGERPRRNAGKTKEITQVRPRSGVRRKSRVREKKSPKSEVGTEKARAVVLKGKEKRT